MNELLTYVQEELKKYDDVPLTTGLLSKIIDNAIQCRDDHEQLLEENYNPFDY